MASGVRMGEEKKDYVTGKRLLRVIGGQAGFTLIEVIIIIVIMSVFMAAFGVPLLTSLRESDVPEIATIAYFLATEKLEELENTTTGSIAAESRSAVSGYEDYERAVAVCDVSCVTLEGPAPDPASNPPNCDPCSDPDCVPAPYPEQGSGCRKVTVTVYHDGKIPNGISVVTLRTSY